MKTPTRPRNAAALEVRRLKAIQLYRRHVPQADIARKLEVSKQAVSVWIAKQSRFGIGILKATSATGRPAKMTFSTLSKQMTAIIPQGPKSFGYETDLWTTSLVRDVLRKKTGVSYHRDHVWKLLKKAGYSCQKPERRAIQRNERAIRRWIREDWPEIKKKPENTRQ